MKKYLISTAIALTLLFTWSAYSTSGNVHSIVWDSVNELFYAAIRGDETKKIYSKNFVDGMTVTTDEGVLVYEGTGDLYKRSRNYVIYGFNYIDNTAGNVDVELEFDDDGGDGGFYCYIEQFNSNGGGTGAASARWSLRMYDNGSTALTEVFNSGSMVMNAPTYSTTNVLKITMYDNPYTYTHIHWKIECMTLQLELLDVTITER